jgi:hypothetical protein
MAEIETQTREPMVRVVEVRCQKCGTAWAPKIKGGYAEYGFNAFDPPVFALSFLRQMFRHRTTDSEPNLAIGADMWQDDMGCGGQMQFDLEPVP